MEQKSIILNIDIEPIFLVKDIKIYILEKLKNKYINSCTEKNGYIIDILSIEEIIENLVFRKLENRFNSIGVGIDEETGEEIIKMISSRTYQIKNSIDFLRFQSGM